MKSFGTGKSILLFAVVVAITAVILAGCDSAGAGGGGGAGGSYDITFEVTGSYTSNLIVTYSYDTPSQAPGVVVQEDDPTLPFSETVTVEAGTGVSLVVALVDGSVECTLKQDGTVIESQQIASFSSCDIGHTVGQ
jgi:hypothetical protein